ncbi:hypothetical protein AAG570_006293 [Ranatra chinensis]|uniref:Dynein heavy chain 3 AAA+ lid domain-containing protein n=1 Tax=Ranatra chinensis TaxID=642074 RepID=A0ABD0YTN6_9HEMI
MASKRRNMFYQNKKQETTEIGITLLKNNTPVLLIGVVGTGKSSTAISVLDNLDSSKYSLLTVNMSAQDMLLLAAMGPPGEGIVKMTISLYKTVIEKMLPTPAKMHYLFNLRDISKVFQGLLRSNTDNQNKKPNFLRLWIHEAFRVFNDRLIDEE